MNPDTPQTFIAYTWGAFEKHRDAIQQRTFATTATVFPKIKVMVNAQFGFGAMIFPQGRFPGRYLAAVPQQ